MSERDDVNAAASSAYRMLGALGMAMIIIALLGMIFLQESQVRDLQRRVGTLESAQSTR
jgi:hypothetical protein